jgi:hypothetical protein
VAKRYVKGYKETLYFGGFCLCVRALERGGGANEEGTVQKESSKIDSTVAGWRRVGGDYKLLYIADSRQGTTRQGPPRPTREVEPSRAPGFGIWGRSVVQRDDPE